LESNPLGRPWSADMNCSLLGNSQWFQVTSWDCPSGAAHQYKYSVWGQLAFNGTAYTASASIRTHAYDYPFDKTVCPS
jgi:hypothetical protein